jgi:hypothetical protein
LAGTPEIGICGPREALNATRYSSPGLQTRSRRLYFSSLAGQGIGVTVFARLRRVQGAVGRLRVTMGIDGSINGGGVNYDELMAVETADCDA